MPDTTPTPTFFQQRMLSLGITDEHNKITVFDPEAEYPQVDRFITSIFNEDGSTGDIEILYYTVEGDLIRYTHMGDGKMSQINAKTYTYKTRRLKEPKGDMKYQMPVGQPTQPWFPPALVDKFKNKEKITHLVLTEGVFKAMKGSMHGLDIVGLPSITCYKNRDGKIYDDIRRLLIQCDVDYVIILWDGDCLNISLKDLQVQDEITKRPATFYSSAKKISELIAGIEYPKTRSHPGVWFAHVKSEVFQAKPKGLDDLLIEAAKESKEGGVVREIQHLLQDDYFFVKKNITTTSATLHKYFRLHDFKAFYDLHRDIIGSREFKFHDTIYKWSETKNELVMETPGWAKHIKWVGDEFFKEEVVPGAVRNRRQLLHWNEGTFSKLYGKDFLKYLSHYRAFCNVPDHFNYQQVIEMEDGAKFYNRYFPFPHVGVEGKYDVILNLIKHIFGDHEITHGLDPAKKYRSWELGLDYIQLLLTKPNQVLPVLCLYSPENNTGKSTLGKLLMHIFGDNAIPIGNQDLQSDFNEQYVDKLLAICDETLLERKKDAERIKAMSTADQISANPKGQKQYTIDFFCKFIFTSNNIRMVYVNKHDERFWIIRVPVLTKADPHLMDKMMAEVPAFIHALSTRELVTEHESRMHFHASLIRTAIFDEVVRVNEPAAATDLREQLREWFIQEEGMEEIRMTLKEIREEFFGSKVNVAWIQEILKDYLNVDLARNADGEAVFERGKYVKYESQMTVHDGQSIIRVEKPYRGRPYVFKRADLLGDLHIKYQKDAATEPQASEPPAVQSEMVFEAAAEIEDVPF